MTPYILVFLQFSSLFVFLFSSSFFAKEIVLLLIQLFGIFLGVWAILVMRIGNFNIIPVPVREGEMIVRGPYKLIRHPMYTSILVFTAPLLIDSFNYYRLLLFAFIFISLILKLSYEERRLKEEFDDYQMYMRKTKRLIPFIF